MPRYRFSQFIVSPRRRTLVRDGLEQPIIPRYFDLLVFLIERRHEAVHRREIFDRVWSDVIVSDSALSQAIRTIRRTLGDDPRDPRFIRTVSRHGYRFVYSEVVEEADEAVSGAAPPERTVPAIVAEPAASADTAAEAFERLLERVTRPARTATEEEEQREAAELLHGMGTTEALRRLGARPGHELARALLRDTRWDVAIAGDVPLAGEPGAAGAARALIRLRLRRAARIAAARWAAASVGGGCAGLAAGFAGGLLLAAAPASTTPLALAAVLAVIGAICGALGATGIGAGLSLAEATARSRRTIALVCGAAAGGASIGFIVQWLAWWSLATLVGLRVPIGGGIEGLAIGGAAGIGYALATARVHGGLAAPRGPRRLRAVTAIAGACGLSALLMTLAGRPLIGGTIHRIAEASRGSQATLTPFGRLLGEPDFGPLSRVVIGTGEGILFGLGLGLGLTHRPFRGNGST